MPARNPVLVAAAWLATVAGASALTWTVISAAGARVGQPVVVTPPNAGPASPDAPGQAWTGPGGRVTVRCTGDQVALGTAVPGDGYRVEVKDRGPERLRLEFEPQDGGAGEEVTLTVTCAGGVPQFRRG